MILISVLLRDPASVILLPFFLEQRDHFLVAPSLRQIQRRHFQLSFESTSAPASSSDLAASTWPRLAAQLNGVLRVLSFESTSAPASTNNLTASTWPFKAARFNAVIPL